MEKEIILSCIENLKSRIENNDYSSESYKYCNGDEKERTEGAIKMLEEDLKK